MVVDSDSISEMDDDSSTDSSSDLISVSDESCSATYQRHQDKYLQPVIVASWVEQRAALLAERRGMPLTIGCDGRADSRGHSAKFGCYTIMDLKTNEIIDMKLIQKNEVTSSNHMELEGLKRGIDALLEEGIRIGELITDRHPSVTKWVCENLGRSIFLTFGTLPKVLVKRLTQRLNLLIVAYCKSGGGVIINHLDMGTYTWECQHAPLGDEEEKRKKWIFPACVKVLLQKVISEVDGSSTTSQGDLSLISSPPPTLSSRCERPDKELAKQELQSRFK
uniref:uncharacterized protein LOC120343880 n=1 Tax=Styela clava TaxID=7725 RepID=UPI00193AB8AD|nr:uncharacterized protein LOC120343880 [Styela clava]